MPSIFDGISIIWTSLYGLSGLLLLGLGVYWFFNKKAKERQLAKLRKLLDELQPTDPQYNQVRALYTAMMIEGQRGDFFGHTSGDETGTHHPDASHYSGGESSENN